MAAKVMIFNVKEINSGTNTWILIDIAYPTPEIGVVCERERETGERVCVKERERQERERE